MFNPGDVLLYEAPAWQFKNFFAKCIQLIQGNDVIHVALYLKPSGSNHIILEALTDGVKIKTMSTNELRNRSNGFVLFGTSRLKENSSCFDAGMVFIDSFVYNGRSYGFLTDFNLFLQHGKTKLFKKLPWTVWFHSKDKYICSEVTQLVLESVLEYNLKPNPFPKKACLTEPDDYLNENIWSVSRF